MIPGESNGTERTVRPFSSVVWRIGSGKIFSFCGARLGSGAAARPRRTSGNIPARRFFIGCSVSGGVCVAHTVLDVDRIRWVYFDTP